jgi:DNA-directed RNA polymerase specialized sigma24 family protein
MPMTTTSYDLTTATRSVTVADLLPRVSDGDPAAWEEILRRYGKLVTATVRSSRLQHADTLDAVQTTWLQLARNAHLIHNPERLDAWLATTARRECLRILRQVKRTPNPMGAVGDTVADPSVGPEQQAIDADTARTLWKLV